MTVTSVGGQTVGRPELTKAIEGMAAKATKQLDATGTLAGFSSKYEDATGDGTIDISISALAASLYDKSAGKGDSILAFSLQASDGFESGGTGSSLTIKSDQDIEDFVEKLIANTKQLSFGQGWFGPPDEIAALFGADSTSSDSTGSNSTTSIATEISSTTSISISATIPDKSSSASAGAKQTLFAALQKQQDDSDKTVSALQEFLDGLRELNKQSFASASSPHRHSGGHSATTALLSWLGAQG